MVVQALSFCPWLLIMGRLLIGMGKKLTSVSGTQIQQ